MYILSVSPYTHKHLTTDKLFKAVQVDNTTLLSLLVQVISVLTLLTNDWSTMDYNLNNKCSITLL